jgi:hypothetical protein
MGLRRQVIILLSIKIEDREFDKKRHTFSFLLRQISWYNDKQ